jgi:formiminotetrahydrofolate cyclodeaminase
MRGHVQTLDGWLDDLASASPAPGGGAAAAVANAIGAALISMVCNLTIGKPKFADVEPAMRDVLADATTLRHESLAVAGEDAAAFDAVIAAYRLPKQTADEQAARSAAIQDALVAAAEVPLRLAGLAADVIALAERIVDDANPNVVSDVAVAASSARAALEAAVVNVEVNVASITDPDRRAALAARLADLDRSAAAADRVVRRVRDRLS